MINIWKVSTLVFAGAFAFVVGRGAIAESIACDGVEAVPTAEQITRLRLARGLAFLDRAEQEIEAATAAPTRARTNALAQIAKARSSLELALNPEEEVVVPAPLPPPRPRPVIKVPSKKPAGSTTSASTSADIVNPFLRVEKAAPATVPAVVKDPWMTARN
jgi:hypothetical protein